MPAGTHHPNTDRSDNTDDRLPPPPGLSSNGASTRTAASSPEELSPITSAPSAAVATQREASHQTETAPPENTAGQLRERSRKLAHSTQMKSSGRHRRCCKHHRSQKGHTHSGFVLSGSWSVRDVVNEIFPSLHLLFVIKAV